VKCWRFIYWGARGIGIKSVHAAAMHHDDRQFLKQVIGEPIRKALSEVPKKDRPKIAYYIRDGVREAKLLAKLGRVN
jgi:hypothetical protein